MTPTLSERLGKKGFTIVARAPQVDLPQFADGSWHVVGGSNPMQPDQMHEFEPEVIPYILSKGGDIVLYRLSDDGMGEARPVLSRGGMSGRPPKLSTVLSFDHHLSQRLAEMKSGQAEPVAPPEPPRAQRWIDGTAAACLVSGIAAGLALLISGTAYLTLMAPKPGRWVPDMTNPRDVAITKGATVMALPSENNPEMMVLYRMYPGTDGKGVRENVGTFKRRDLEHVKGELPDSRLEWRRKF